MYQCAGLVEVFDHVSFLRERRDIVFRIALQKGGPKGVQTDLACLRVASVFHIFGFLVTNECELGRRNKKTLCYVAVRSGDAVTR